MYRDPVYSGVGKILLRIFIILIIYHCISIAPSLAQLSALDIEDLQKRAMEEGWTFSVGLNSATQYSLDQLCGFEVPPDWREMASFDLCLPKGSLPVSFDWRDSAALTPIRDQGGCGSCWAFSTTGPLESAIKREFGIYVDLSEQWLIDCNTHMWGCYGGYYAHDYHMWKVGKCGHYGAVPEEDFPYLEEEGYCNGEHTHPYIIHDWSYIGDDLFNPSIEAMKQAILDYGPICAGIFVNDPFRAYTGGVFNACNDSIINHTINIVGWDDTQGTNGIWIIRNSWGTDWGEDGYMRIEYGCSYVGQSPNYVEFIPLREQIPLLSRTGLLILIIVLILTVAVSIWYRRRKRTDVSVSG
ncbi:MAG: C1 family peptidase [Candidatus Zixiibacteriota bacterium]